MSPISDSPAATASTTRPELYPRSTKTDTLVIRRGSGRDGGGGGGGNSPTSTPWIAVGAIVCFLILFALLVCWGARRRRAAITARRERLERDKRRYEIEMGSLGHQGGVEPPPDYVVTMLEQPVPVPVHLREGDHGERFVA
jgi:hypothetical protein